VSGGVVLGRFARVVHSVRVMAVRRMSVVCGLLMVAGFVMLGGFAMMPCSVLVMLGGVMVMLSGFLGHDAISSPEMIYR
jgi:hypothetical protein